MFGGCVASNVSVTFWKLQYFCHNRPIRGRRHHNTSQPARAPLYSLAYSEWPGRPRKSTSSAPWRPTRSNPFLVEAKTSSTPAPAPAQLTTTIDADTDTDANDDASAESATEIDADTGSDNDGGCWG